MPAVAKSDELRDQILKHPRLQKNAVRKARLTTRTIFMAPERLTKMLKQLDQEANQAKFVHA